MWIHRFQKCYVTKGIFLLSFRLRCLWDGGGAGGKLLRLGWKRFDCEWLLCDGNLCCVQCDQCCISTDRLHTQIVFQRALLATACVAYVNSASGKPKKLGKLITEWIANDKRPVLTVAKLRQMPRQSVFVTPPTLVPIVSRLFVRLRGFSADPLDFFQINWLDLSLVGGGDFGGWILEKSRKIEKLRSGNVLGASLKLLAAKVWQV